MHTDRYMAKLIGTFLQLLIANSPADDSVIYCNFYKRDGKAKEFLN
jgi:hypothetical protein